MLLQFFCLISWGHYIEIRPVEDLATPLQDALTKNLAHAKRSTEEKPELSNAVERAVELIAQEGVKATNKKR